MYHHMDSEIKKRQKVGRREETRRKWGKKKRNEGLKWEKERQNKKRQENKEYNQALLTYILKYH
jgi:hypothetical protein